MNILILLFLFSILYFTDHLITVHRITKTHIGFELNPIIRILWAKWGIWGFVIMSIVTWSAFILVFYLHWEHMGLIWKIVFYLVMFNFLVTNLNHIFHFI